MKRTDLTGVRFGKLVAIKPGETEHTKGGQSRSTWICKCDCGNIKQIRTNNLMSGNTTACGCEKAKNNHERNFIDEVGNTYGKLVVLKRNPLNDVHGKALWVCQCECGNERIVSGTDLRNGRVNNCGCSVSKNEIDIEKILKDNNINYVKQYSFDDLKSDRGVCLRFDFGIIVDNKLSHLIEYDGIQHFYFKENTSGWNTEENFIRTQKHDKTKDNYCLERGIKLIRIKYDEEYTFETLMGKESNG